MDVAGLEFFTREEWRTDVTPPEIGVLGLITGTVIVAVIAVLIAIPLGVCAALFITEYASPRMRPLLTSVVDLLAAVPSLLYGLWGFQVFQDQPSRCPSGWPATSAGSPPSRSATTPSSPTPCSSQGSWSR